MSEPRKECYKCSYKDKCRLQVVYDSAYCKEHRECETKVKE